MTTTFRRLAVAALVLHVAPSAGAVVARLSTPAGDGGVSIQVDAYGAFGYRTFGFGAGGEGDAMYDPVGAVGPSSTSWQSAVYLRLPPRSTFLTIGSVGQGRPSGSLPDVGFLFQDGTRATSRFTHEGLDWDLTQWVEDVFDGGSRVGSMLVQEYAISNPGPAPVTFSLVRYFEGDLFLGLGAGVPDGGGHVFAGAEELVFETDRAGEPAATTNLVGITACGGTVPSRGRYEVAAWSAFPDRISADLPLADVVAGDGGDADEFVDAGADYDVGIALSNDLTIDPGVRLVYITTTVFGTLPPADVSAGCAAFAAPRADAGLDVRACPGATVTLDGSASFDTDGVDGGVTPSWTWDLDIATDSSGNGVPNDDTDATGAIVLAAFPAGVTTAQLTYVDDDGVAAIDFVTVTIADDAAPVTDCPAIVTAPATSFLGGAAVVGATATDDCDPLPSIRNDRTGGGADASDDYPCGSTAVRFTTTDASGRESSCLTEVRIVPPTGSGNVGPTLRVTRPGIAPRLDWTLLGPVPSEVRFAVLRGTERRAPDGIAPGAGALDVEVWEDPDLGGSLVFYDVRSVLCDRSLSED